MSNPAPTEAQQQEDRIRREWFPHHVAQFTIITPTIRGLVWRNPDTTNYYCRYLIEGPILTVYGDIGEAVYGWGQSLTWDWLSGLDLDYFAGKCFASEHGRGYKSWNPNRAHIRLMEQVRSDEQVRNAFNRVAARDQPALAFQDEWNLWLHRNGYDVFGDDFGCMSDIGKCIDIRCHGHLVGIKMAVAQALEKGIDIH